MIVLNTLNYAVTEYGLAPQSMTPTHIGDAAGLYLLGGDLDGAAPIVGRFVSGLTELGSSMKRRVRMVYFAMRSDSDGALVVQTPDNEYTYAFHVRASGQSRCQPGQGIRENYLAFGFESPDGGDFKIDRIEVMLDQSATRRI